MNTSSSHKEIRCRIVREGVVIPPYTIAFWNLYIKKDSEEEIFAGTFATRKKASARCEEIFRKYEQEDKKK